ncbi:MAG: porin [Holosporales bacterium]|jgi:hypothetical protein|nr:porin [Holosporales bacterium]
MKKSSLIVSSFLLINPCLANSVSKTDNIPQFTISGAAAVHSNFSSPKNRYYIENPQEADKKDKDSTMPRISAGEANILFNAKGFLPNGIEYSATVDLEVMKGATGVDKMYLSFLGRFGIIQVGNVKGPDGKSIYSGQQLIGGTTGVDGTVPHDMDYAAGVISPICMVGYSSKATKIVYYSPIIHGFQFGIGITPDTKHHGHNDKSRGTGSSSNGNDDGVFIKGDADKQKPSGRNNVAMSISHFHDFESKFSTKLAAVLLFEDTRKVKIDDKDVELNNAKAYHLSGTVGYNDKIFVGVGFIDNGKSRIPKETVYDYENVRYGNFMSTKDGNAGHAWNVGIRYNLDDKWSFSSVLHKVQRKVSAGERTKGDMLTFAIDYKVCDGFMLFAEFDHIKTKSCKSACEQYNSVFKDAKDKNAIAKQRCQLFVIGAKVSF